MSGQYWGPEEKSTQALPWGRLSVDTPDQKRTGCLSDLRANGEGASGLPMKENSWARNLPLKTTQRLHCPALLCLWARICLSVLLGREDEAKLDSSSITGA